jgi:hypothetical protein
MDSMLLSMHLLTVSTPQHDGYAPTNQAASQQAKNPILGGDILSFMFS